MPHSYEILVEVFTRDRDDDHGGMRSRGHRCLVPVCVESLLLAGHWFGQYLGQSEDDRWYCIEQYARLDTPGVGHAVPRGRADGGLAFEKADIRMRDVPELRTRRIWINIDYDGK